MLGADVLGCSVLGAGVLCSVVPGVVVLGATVLGAAGAGAAAACGSMIIELIITSFSPSGGQVAAVVGVVADVTKFVISPEVLA